MALLETTAGLKGLSLKWIIFVIGLLVTGCTSEGANKSELAAGYELERRVLIAMCTPWGTKREYALADLVEAAQNPDLGQLPSSDYIAGIAGQVTEDDCRKAGFSATDPPVIEEQRLRRRCRRIHVPPPPAKNIADQKKIDVARKKLLDRCAALAPDQKM